jgi:aspartokinase
MTYEKVTYHSPVAIVSVFGPHFREKPAIAGTMFAALGNFRNLKCCQFFI